ncbi:MAG: sugar phosphate nucleotidyltransferase [Pirellulaceae bacterium]
MKKPQTDAEVEMVKMDPAWIDRQGLESRGRECLASMGLYIFNRDLLFEILEKTSYEDFGKEVFPAAIRSRKVQVHLFDDYWEDIGTIRAFYEANLQLTRQNAPFDLVCPSNPVYSRARYLPPSRLDGATVNNSLIADGCRIGAGTVIENSIIGLRCVIGENVTIRNSIIMGSDYLDNDEDLHRFAQAGEPNTGIGDGSKILGAILDKNCRVGSNVVVENASGIDESDQFEPCLIRDGLPILLKDAMLPDNFVMK